MNHGKKKKSWGILLTAALIFAHMFSACGSENTVTREDRYVVGVVTKSASSEYWMTVQSGMEAAAEETGMEIVFLSPDSELDEDVQIKMAQQLLNSDIDALAVSPINSAPEENTLNLLEEADIPIVTFDTAIEDSQFPYVGVDNETLGYELAKELAEQIGHSGEVGIITGSLEQTGHKMRMEGFCRYMETEENITIDFIESGYANLQLSAEKANALLDEYPNLKGLMATSGVTAMGLCEEYSSRGVRIVTFDEQKDTMEALEKGTICALAAQSGYDIGYETIQLLQEIRENGQTGEDRILEVDILTGDDADE